MTGSAAVGRGGLIEAFVVNGRMVSLFTPEKAWSRRVNGECAESFIFSWRACSNLVEYFLGLAVFGTRMGPALEVGPFQEFGSGFPEGE